MTYLGFVPTSATKGWFTDNHERADILEDRKQFLVTMADYERRSKLYEGKDREIEVAPNLAPGEKEVVTIVHDESTFYCNEGRKIFWMENGKKKLLPKSWH